MSLWNGFDISGFMDKQTGKLQEDVVLLTIDLGHGQCSAACVGKKYKDVHDLMFDDEKRTIPSAIYYTEGKTEIGYRAAGKKGCIYYFKDSPGHFDDKIGSHTKKELMKDFVSKLFKSLLKHNDRRFSPDSRVLLFVGCPSSEREWLIYKKEYAEMIQEAVKGYVKDVRVVILPESRAAFVNIAKKRDLYLDKGILVLDFGSSTADATWMQTGKKPIEKSWRLGASEIEKLMLKLALEDAGYCLSDLGFEFGALYNWDYRRKKESYFSGEVITPSLIVMPGKSNPIRVKDIDENYMQRAVGYHSENKSAVSAEQIKLRGDGRMGSWAEHCRRFVREVLQEMKTAGCNCQAIILTGGASKMEFIRNICREEVQAIYPGAGIKVERADEPSLSVSRGLAYAALNDQNAEEIKNELVKKLQPGIEKELEEFVSSAASKLADTYYSTAIPVIEAWADDSKTPEPQRNSKYLRTQLSNKFKSTIKDQDVKKILEKSFDETIGKCRERIQEDVNKYLQKVYQNRLDKNSYTLDKKKWKQIMVKCDVGKLCDSGVPSMLNMNALGWAMIIALAIPLLIIDEVFGTNLVERVDDMLDTRKQWQSTRQRAFQKTKDNYKNEVKGKLERLITTMIKEQREKDKLQLEELIVGALDDAFDIMAFYGE